MEVRSTPLSSSESWRSSLLEEEEDMTRRGGEGKAVGLMPERVREGGEGNMVGREDLMRGGKLE